MNALNDVDEIDRQIIHALQISPRISWSALGEIIGRSPATIAQRWNRLEAEGHAWLVAYESLGPRAILAFVTVTIDVDHRETVLNALNENASVMALSEGARASALHITVSALSLELLIHEVLDDIAQIPGIRDTHARFVARLLAEGASWRFDALDAGQQALVRASAENTTPVSWKPSPEPMLDDDSRELARAFMKNPRIRVAQLAQELDLHEATVRRRLSALLQSGAITIRCEMTYGVSGWPVERSWFLRVPDAGIAALTAIARDYRGLRLVSLTIGDANIVITVLSRTLEESIAFEAQLLGASPGITITESVLHLRTWKRMFRSLGRFDRSVWSTAAPQHAESGDEHPVTQSAPGERSDPRIEVDSVTAERSS